MKNRTLKFSLMLPVTTKLIGKKRRHDQDNSRVTDIDQLRKYFIRPEGFFGSYQEGLVALYRHKRCQRIEWYRIISYGQNHSYLLVNTLAATPFPHTRTINEDIWIYWIIKLPGIKILNFGTKISKHDIYSTMIITKRGTGNTHYSIW